MAASPGRIAPMEDLKEKQARNLKTRLEQLEAQMAEKIKSSNYAYEHGGDGWPASTRRLGEAGMIMPPGKGYIRKSDS